MAESKRVQVLTEFDTRVKRITQANGFNTGAGQYVFLGEIPGLGTDDPDVAIAIIVGNVDRPAWQGEHGVCHLPVGIAAVAKAGRSDSWRVVEQIVQDIKRAIEVDTDPNRNMGRLLAGRMERGEELVFGREDGSDIVGSVITYYCPVAEKWGNP